MSERKVKMLIGLKAQGHIPVIEKMLIDHCCWAEIAKEIGWCQHAAKEAYLKYLTKDQKQAISKLTEALQHIKDHQEICRVGHYELSTVWRIANTVLNQVKAGE